MRLILIHKFWNRCLFFSFFLNATTSFYSLLEGQYNIIPTTFMSLHYFCYDFHSTWSMTIFYINCMSFSNYSTSFKACSFYMCTWYMWGISVLPTQIHWGWPKVMAVVEEQPCKHVRWYISLNSSSNLLKIKMTIVCLLSWSSSTHGKNSLFVQSHKEANLERHIAFC